MTSTLAPATSEAPQAPERRRMPQLLAPAAAAGAVLVWFAIALGKFVGDPPDLDAMVSMRESLIVKRDGFQALIDSSAAGVHPPVLDLLSAGAFTLFGEDARSLSIVAIVLFLVLAVAVERMLAPWLENVFLRVAAALAVAISPSLAVATFLVSREGLMLAVLAVALALAVTPGGGLRRRVALGLVLALMPLIKETGLLLAAPFGLFAFLVGEPGWRARLIRGATVLVPVAAAAGAWRLILSANGGKPWESWLLTPNAEDGAYAVGIRALLGQEDGIFLRQNLANGLFVNWLWVPAALAVVALALCLRPSAPKRLRQAIALVAGLAVVYAWTTLTFPTYTIPRYATPLTMLVILVAVLGVALWPRMLRPVPLVALIAVFLLGASSPTDPLTKDKWGTVSVGGERIYDTTEVNRGPDRIMANLAMLNATEGLNGRLREIFASQATIVTGDCFTLKAGEKLYSIGLAPEAYERAFPGARALGCFPVDQLPQGAAQGPPGTVALLRSPEEIAAGYPPAIRGPAVFVVK